MKVISPEEVLPAEDLGVPGEAFISPEEVLPAEDLGVPGEAFVLQRSPAVAAPQTLGVPRLVQDVHQKPARDRLFTIRAVRHAKIVLNHSDRSPI